MDITMSIANMATSKAATDIQSKASIMMLSKALDTQKEIGASMIKMMEQSVNPEIGQNIDVRI